MNIRQTAAVILSAVLLAACSDVPENLKDRDSRLGNTEQAEFHGDYQKGSVELIRNELDSDSSKKYGEITVKYASAGDSERMPVYKLEVGGGGYTVDQLAEYLYKDRFDPDSCTRESMPWNFRGAGPVPYDNQYETEFTLWAPGIYYDMNTIYPYQKEDGTCLATVCTNGACQAASGQNGYDDEDYFGLWNGESVEHYYPEYQDISSAAYKMHDGSEWPLSDAVRFTEQVWNGELSKNDPQKYTYKVWRVDVIRLPANGNYGYLFMMSYEDENGCRYDCDTYDEFLLHSDRVYNGKRFFLGQTQWQFSLKKDEVTRFEKAFSFKRTEVPGTDSELLTLGSALSILQSELAEYLVLDFDTAELCYIVTCDKYPEKDYGGKVKYSPSYCMKACELYARPYWCFRSSNGILDDWSSTRNCYVDAQSGEIIQMKLQPDG